MRFEEAYTGWQERRLTQAEAARLPGVSERALRRQIGRYGADGMDGLIDKRLTQLSHKRAPVDEVMVLVDLYRSDYPGWNVRHFHTWYTRDHGGRRSYLEQVYLPQINAEFRVKASAEGSAFIPYIGNNLPDVLCEQHERIVGNDNCVSFEGMKLQIPADGARHHYVRVTVRVHRYADGTLGVFHGPRKLAGYDARGNLPLQVLKQAA